MHDNSLNISSEALTNTLGSSECIGYWSYETLLVAGRDRATHKSTPRH
ncbi:hypothetical protein [Nostoc sp. MG11]|nr:hypothetical protein [Nostoc sp. MG11]